MPRPWRTTPPWFFRSRPDFSRFFQSGRLQTDLVTSRGHTLNAAAPLFNEPQFVENTPDYAVLQDQRSSLRTPSIIDSRAGCFCMNALAFFRALRQKRADLRGIHQTCSIRSGKTTRVNPGIEKSSEPVLAKK
jgi:hypothetical protein